MHVTDCKNISHKYIDRLLALLHDGLPQENFGSASSSFKAACTIESYKKSGTRTTFKEISGNVPLTPTDHKHKAIIDFCAGLFLHSQLEEAQLLRSTPR